MPGHDIIAVASSAGGIEALREMVHGLPKDLPASIFIVQHIPAEGVSVLPSILSRSGPLPASHPTDNSPFSPGHIYIAPPDHHMLVRDGHIRVVRGPKENLFRPAADPLFRSVAISHGTRAIGVILTGALDDGTIGLKVIKERGGIAVVQDPDDAIFPGMPRSAIENVKVDHVVPLNRLSSLLVDLVNRPAEDPSNFPLSANVALETRIAMMEDYEMDSVDKLGKPSEYACPDCHGILWEIQDGDMPRFRCRVGHAYSAESMVAEHSESLESALWAALRALEESASLTRRMAERAHAQNHGIVASRYESRADDAEENAAVLRQVLLTTSGNYLGDEVKA